MTILVNEINAELSSRVGNVEVDLRDAQVISVQKNPGPGQFSSVKSAIDSITDASSSNRYLIKIAPGTYSEDPFTIPSWVTLKGCQPYSTILTANNAVSDFITLSSEANIVSVSLEGTSTGSLLNFNPDTLLGASRINDIVFGGSYSSLVKMRSDNAMGLLLVDHCRSNNTALFTLGFDLKETNFPISLVVSDFLFQDNTAPYSGNVIDAEGANSEVLLTSFAIRTNSGASIGIRGSNGINLKSSGISIGGYGTGLQVGSGGSPKLQLSDASIVDCGTAIDIVNSSTTGYISGVWDNSMVSNTAGNNLALAAASPSNSFYVNEQEVATVDPHVVRVKADPGPNDFASIAAAVASITTASSTNPFLVEVGPGVYTEPTIVMKPYVSIRGEDRNAVIVNNQDPDTYLFTTAGFSSISDMTIQGGTGLGGTIQALNHIAPMGIFFVRDITFGPATTLIKMDTTIFTQVTVFTCFATGNIDFDTAFDITGSGTNVLAIIAFNMQIPSAAALGTFVNISGTSNYFNCANTAILSGGGTLESVVTGENGATIQISDMTSQGVNNGLTINNVGTGCNISLTNFNVLSSFNTAINILHAGTTGFISGAFDSTQTYTASHVVGIAHSDPGVSSTVGFSVIGDIIHADAGENAIDLSYLARTSATMGIFSGGVLSKNGANFLVDITAGRGYINDSNDIVQEITWSATQVTLGAEEVRYITVNENGLVQAEANLPSDYSRRVVLGRVVAGDTQINTVERVPIDAKHHGNKVEQYLREVFKAIFATGGVANISAVPSQVDVSAATYYLGSYRHTTLGQSPITFAKLYQDGLGDWTGAFGLQDIPNNEWDDGTGSIAAVSASGFTKHALVLDIDEGNEVYALVLSQDVYPDLVTAQAADLPTLLPEFTDSVILIAAIIMQEGITDIQEIIDVRPRPGFAAASTGGVTDHGGLTGLGDDDHPQYILADASRPFTGNINVGGNSITNVNLVDGVDVSAHASRHLPNGADPLTSAAPTSNLTADTTNAVGIQNSFSRSDHSHNIDTGVASTIDLTTTNTEGTSPNLARADHTHNIDVTYGVPSQLTPELGNSEGVSPNLARADHIHDIPTDVAVGLGPSSTNTEGTANSFSRSDHTHSIAVGSAPVAEITTVDAGDTPSEGVSSNFARGDHEHGVSTGVASSITPDLVNAEGTSTNLARADHIHNIPATAPTTSLSGDTANAEGTAASFARGDHTHDILTGSAVPLDASSTSTEGSSANLSRADHTHAIGTALVAEITTVDAGDTASAGVSNNYARGDHQHAVSTGIASTLTPELGNSEGISTALARADHIHDIPSGAAVTLGANSTNTEGTASAFARTDHTHDLNTGVVSTLNPDQVNAEGTSDNLARADHIHNVPADTAVNTSANANTEGTSTSFARADHTHQLSSNTPTVGQRMRWNGTNWEAASLYIGYVAFENTLQTLSTTYINAATLNVTIPEAGNYMIQYTWEAMNSQKDRDTWVRVQVDSADINENIHGRENDQAGNDFQGWSGFKSHTFTAGSHTITMDYRAGANEAFIRRGRIYVARFE